MDTTFSRIRMGLLELFRDEEASQKGEERRLSGGGGARGIRYVQFCKGHGFGFGFLRSVFGGERVVRRRARGSGGNRPLGRGDGCRQGLRREGGAEVGVADVEIGAVDLAVGVQVALGAGGGG